MRKTIQCKSAPEIEIIVDGGEAVLLRFDISCLANLQEQANGLNNLFKQSVTEQTALIIYSAAKDNNENFTLEDARKMVACMDIASVNGVLEAFAESAGTAEGKDDTIKKVLAQMLK